MSAKIVITVVAIVGAILVAVVAGLLLVVFGSGFVFYKFSSKPVADNQNNVYYVDMTGATDNTTNFIRNIYEDNGKNLDGIRVWVDGNVKLPCEIRTASDLSSVNILKNVSYIRLLKINNGQTTLIADWGDAGTRDTSQKEMWMINSTDKSQDDFALEFVFKEKESTNK